MENLALKITLEDKKEQLEMFNSALHKALTTYTQTHNTKLDTDKHIHCYTDGSGPTSGVTKHSLAGWGFHIVDGPTHSGRVTTNTTSPLYLGASVGSNNTAELTAIAEAILWSCDFFKPRGPLPHTC